MARVAWKISRWSSAGLLLGALILLTFGDRAASALAFGLAVLLWGAGSVAGEEDRKAGWVLVVAGGSAALGAMGHLVSGVES